MPTGGLRRFTRPRNWNHKEAGQIRIADQVVSAASVRGHRALQHKWCCGTRGIALGYLRLERDREPEPCSCAAGTLKPTPHPRRGLQGTAPSCKVPNTVSAGH